MFRQKKCFIGTLPKSNRGSRIIVKSVTVLGTPALIRIQHYWLLISREGKRFEINIETNILLRLIFDGDFRGYYRAASCQSLIITNSPTPPPQLSPMQKASTLKPETLKPSCHNPKPWTILKPTPRKPQSRKPAWENTQVRTRRYRV